MFKRTIPLLLAGTILSFGGVANAQDTSATTQMNASANTSTSATATSSGMSLAQMQDDAYVVVDGTVGEISGDEFTLNMTNGSIVVELDRFDWDGDETKYLTVGESVTVTGFIDDDFLEGREIEATQVLLNDSYVYYYTGDAMPSYEVSMQDGAYISTTGQVSNLNGDEFIVTNRNSQIKVDVSELGYDPTDEEGLQKIENGDTVYVYGNYDKGVFEANELVAQGIIKYTN